MIIFRIKGAASGKTVLSVLFCFFLFSGFQVRAMAGDEIRERVFVQTDRDLYVAGEDLFFSFQLFNNSGNAKTTSNFGYIALRSPKGIVKQQAIKLEKAFSHGFIYLPDTLTTGFYELVAFTNWMRNEGEESFFRRPVFIVNRFDNDLKPLQTAAGSGGSPEVTFHAEGGSLVAETQANVLVKTPENLDYGLRKAFLLNEAYDTIGTFRLHRQGWGVISFKPETEKKHYLAVEGLSEKFTLPKPRESGVSMSLKQVGSSLNVFLQSKLPEPAKAMLQVHQENKPVLVQNLEIHEGHQNIDIPSDLLKEGLVRIQLDYQNGKPLERWWYFERPAKLPEIKVNEHFRTRNKATLSISAQNGEVSALSVWVSKALCNNPDNFSLQNYHSLLKMATDLQTEPNILAREFVNLQLHELNEKLIGFDESLIQRKTEPSSRAYFMETTRQLISGRVIHEDTGEPAADVRLILNVPDTVVNLIYTHTKDDGSFQFSLSPYYDNKYLFITVDPSTVAERLKIELHDKFRLEAPFAVPRPARSWRNPDNIAELQESVKLRKAFGLKYVMASPRETETIIHPSKIFSRANLVINPENFEPLDDIREIARELVLPWRVRRAGDGFTHSLVCDATRIVLPGKPLLFIDGVTVFDFDRIMHLGSRQIREIQVLNRNWVHGQMNIPGIIAIFTKTMEHENIHYDYSFLKVFNEAPVSPVLFSAPNYHQPDSMPGNLPDLRETLFWEPDIKPFENETTIEFFTGDLPGEYLITIQGFTSDNKPFSIQRTITVNH